MGRAAALALVLALGLGPVTATAAATVAPAGKGKAEVATEPAEGEAEVDPQLQQAMEAYRRGTENYNLAQYDAALADFKEASSLYASADFQYNIGLCYEKLGKYDEAIQAFVTYLKAKPDAEDRANVENLIAELRDKIEQQKADAEKAEAERLAREEELARQREQQTTTEPTEPVNDGRGLVLSGAALIGVGAAVAVGGGVAFGVLARQRSLAISDAQFEGNPDQLTFAEAQAIEDEGKRFEAIQIGMAAGGTVVAVTGAVLLAVGLRKRQAVQASAWLGPRGTAGLVFTGRF